MRIDDEGWLVAEPGDPAIARFPTVRTSRLVVPQPLGLVWHATGGVGGRGYAETLARRVQRYIRGTDRPASWHLLIAKDGRALQSAPFTVGAWHVGRPGVIAGRRFANINFATSSCELENAGRLRLIYGRMYCWPYFVDPRAPPERRRPDPRCLVAAERAVRTASGIFDAFTPSQENTASLLVAALAGRFGWTRDVCAYGHVDFDPEDREDPGPIWKQALPRILDLAFAASAPSSGHVSNPIR